MASSATVRHLSLHGRRPSRVHCFNTHTCILLLFLWVFIVLRTFYRCYGATTTLTHSREHIDQPRENKALRYKVLSLRSRRGYVPGVSRRRRQPWLWQSFSWHARCRWWHHNDVLKEDIQNTTGLFVDETWDALDSTTASHMAVGGLGDSRLSSPAKNDVWCMIIALAATAVWTKWRSQ